MSASHNPIAPQTEQYFTWSANKPRFRNRSYQLLERRIIVNKLFKTLSILAAITLFSTACGTRADQAQSEK